MAFSPRGISLAEVIVAIGLFSTAIAGMYLGIKPMERVMVGTLKRNVEAAFVNMKIAEVNPNNPAIETTYDVTTKTAQSSSVLGTASALAGTITVTSGSATVTGSGSSFSSAFNVGDIIATAGGQKRQIASIASNTSLTVSSAFSAAESGVTYTQNPSENFYYTRIVDSAGATPDIKNINVYLYRSSSSTSPYRTYRREIVPAFMGYNLGEATNYNRDSLGKVWAPMPSSITFVSTTGSRQNGLNSTYAGTDVDGTSLCATVANTQDTVIFQKQHESNNGSNKLEYKLFGVYGRNYTIRLLATELVSGTVAGNRKMDVTVNGTLQGTLDPYADSSGLCYAVVKSYNVTPADSGSGIGVITVTLTQSSGATLKPRLASLALIRGEQ